MNKVWLCFQHVLVATSVDGTGARVCFCTDIDDEGVGWMVAFCKGLLIPALKCESIKVLILSTAMISLLS